eukprot:1290015-Pyramimonas_sp.AAC.1
MQKCFCGAGPGRGPRSTQTFNVLKEARVPRIESIERIGDRNELDRQRSAAKSGGVESAEIGR